MIPHIKPGRTNHYECRRHPRIPELSASCQSRQHSSGGPSEEQWSCRIRVQLDRAPAHLIPFESNTTQFKGNNCGEKKTRITKAAL